MKEIKIESCPFCGGTEFIECSMDSYGGVYVGKGLRGVGVYATVCRACGSIARSRAQPRKTVT